MAWMESQRKIGVEKWKQEKWNDIKWNQPQLGKHHGLEKQFDSTEDWNTWDNFVPLLELDLTMEEVLL